ncbi:scyllo-inositol 2-dehydrogenase (NADP+) [Kitasatospora sp. GP30]|uniref:Gfo/Idh/MocA family oxidoreductase n=1 Tax=Kitasatospora sp. GP30 TaxID=3035084 RepID=UPI000C70AC69|nr:Gfo/Idh/MocA family oxidoreductase [Kitasatospora sp. GP30]MDH6145612.1 scyllo-inositol 2-dehydrogenase (NADP+) [Kitasatospora sp. GP30]
MANTTPDTSTPTAAPAPLRVGLIGYGLAGVVFHAPLITTTPGLHLAAIVTADPDRRAQAAARHPQAHLLGNADELWPLGLDLVVVATPNRTHIPLATAALRAGVPVVVDKPLAATAAEGAALAELAESRDLLLSVFQNRRWDGDFRTVSELVRAGRLGRVHRFESRFERWRPQLKGGWRELGDPAEVGGVLYDLGSHLVDQALTLLGPVSHVYAEADLRRVGAQADDDAFIALTHADGARSHLWMSAAAADLGPRFRVLGSQASYTSWGLDGQEDALRAGRTPVDEDWGRTPAERYGRLGTVDDSVAHPTLPGAYQRYYQGIAAALHGQAAAPVEPRDAVAALTVLEAARRSAAEGRTVALQPGAHAGGFSSDPAPTGSANRSPHTVGVRAPIGSAQRSDAQHPAL